VISKKEGEKHVPDNSLKTCQRIWSGFTKFIRISCKRGNLCDSIYFGCYKFNAATEEYCYIEDKKPFTEDLKLASSSSKVCAGPEEVVQLANLKQIATVCSCTVEQITQLLSKVKEMAL
jgi:hypothetical protein